MKDLLQYRDGLYYLHTIKNDKEEVAVYLDIYKYLSSETYSKVKSLKIVTAPLTNFTGMCAGLVCDNTNTFEGVKSFLIAVETRRSDTEHRMRIYRVEFDSVLHDLPSSISQIGRCQLQTTSFKNKLTNHQFLPGPCLIWITNYSLVTVFRCCISKVFTSPIVLEKDVKFVLLQAQLVSSDDANIHEQILLACQKLHRDNYQNYKTSLSFFILCYDNENPKIKGIQTIPTDFFIPSEYENISCITVFLHSVKDTSLKCNTEECGSDFATLKRNICCIITTNNQFLVFVEGYPKYCCEIPLLNYTKILKITRYNPYSCSFILQASNGICIVQKNNENGRILVKEVWDKASNAVFGNFLQNGEPQLVILMKGSKNGYPSFILSNSRNRHDQNDTQQKLLQVQEALQRRLLLGQAAFNKVEESLRNKQGILETVVASLKLFQCLGELPACMEIPENLVNLDKEKLAIDPKPHKFPNNDMDLCLKLLSQWNCVCVNNWSIGATFLNQSNKDIESLTGVVITEGQYLESVCKIFGHQIAKIPSQPVLKIEKSSLIKPHQMISVVLSVKMPKMLTTTIKANVIVKWTFQNDQKLITQQLPMCTCINLEDIVSGQKLFELPIMLRLMSLRAMQEVVNLNLISANLSSKYLERILILNKEKKDFPNVYSFYEGTYYLFSDQISVLFGVNFEIEILSTNELSLLIFAREESQLLVFLQWIYSKLSNGFILLPNEHQYGQVCDELYKALKEELLCIEQSLPKDNQNYSDFNEPYKKVQKTTDQMLSKWLEDKNRMTYVQYINFRKCLQELEIVTDNILWKILL